MKQEIYVLGITQTGFDTKIPRPDRRVWLLLSLQRSHVHDVRVRLFL